MEKHHLKLLLNFCFSHLERIIDVGGGGWRNSRELRSSEGTLAVVARALELV